ncbi:protein pitchfork-like [Spea bombifrons]|uniref:protein pitchfork-like n=1 Tax=Spea bombifrons TaxID=233779 RepID=UPI00234AB1BD|nr:protein pitchfork-like [Spea bombifrons]
MERKAGARRKVCFGSSQPRKLFPAHCAPDRMGITLPPIRGNPHLGPGCYFKDDDDIPHKSTSSKRYPTMGASTATRFPPIKQVQTPSPSEYQKFWTQTRKSVPFYAPFNSGTKRFPDRKLDYSSNPAPGTYSSNIEIGRRVQWPGRFGSPDWSAVPSLKKRSLRSELPTDKEFRKNRNRVAYLKLYEADKK